MISTGIRIYALGAVAIGVVGLIWADFALVWQPVPAGLPGRTLLAYLFAALLVAGGIATNRRNTAAAGAALLCGLFSLVVVLMHVPHAILHPGAFVSWSGIAEQLALAAAGLIAYLRLAPGAGAPGYLRAARLAFGVCLIVFGAAHFRYLTETAAMVPGWLPPGAKFWAAATGVAHILAGLAVLSGVAARLAAICLTLMFALFGALVHAPLLWADPHSHLNWTLNAINLTLTGAAWVLADSYATPRRARAA